MRIFLGTLCLALFCSQMACAKSHNSGTVTSNPPVGPTQVDAEKPKGSPVCLEKSMTQTRLVTHYYVPLLETYNDFVCNKMEGTCIYKKDGQEWLHNYGYTDQPLAAARCKNGYGNRRNCLNPCRTVAASMKHHKWGEIVFIPGLVGLKCGSQRDGTEMIHDGYVMVGDTGAQSHFNATGRFDFFWGRCKDRSQGVCHEGARVLSDTATTSPYCIVWDPAQPNQNLDFKNEFVDRVKREAIARGDLGAAEDSNYNP